MAQVRNREIPPHLARFALLLKDPCGGIYIAPRDKEKPES